MLKDKLQREGSQINVAPKWHEFVKERDQFLEEPPSLLFSPSSEACLGAAPGCLLQCKQPDTGGFSTSWDLRGLWGQSRVMHVACAACPHRQGCAFAPWSPPASSLVPNPSPTAHPRWGLLSEKEETEATKSSLIVVLLPRWAICRQTALCLLQPNFLDFSQSHLLGLLQMPVSALAQSLARAGQMEAEKIKLHGFVFKWHYNQDKKSS